MDKEKMREDFEQWASEYFCTQKENISIKWDGIKYEHYHLNIAWNAWKSSRGSLNTSS